MGESFELRLLEPCRVLTLVLAGLDGSSDDLLLFLGQVAVFR